MSCTIATLAACFHLRGFYIDGALIHSSTGEGRISETSYTEYKDRSPYDKHMFPVPVTYTQRYLDTSAQNPYVRIAIGYDVQWSARWSTRLDYSHESSIATGKDRGAERISLGVTWRPFAK